MKKKNFPLILILTIFIFMQNNLLSAQNNDIKKADQLFELRHISQNAFKAHKIYQKVLLEKKNYENLCKLAYSGIFIARFVIPFSNKKKRIQYIREALNCAKKAFKIDSSRVEAGVLLAIAYGEWAQLDRSLSSARTAKNLLEQAIRKDPSFKEGVSYTVLGRLYFKAPAWPISFGNDKKSIKNLRKALIYGSKQRVNYYFLAEVLFNEGYEKEAQQIMNKGIQLKTDPRYIKENKFFLQKLLRLKKRKG